MTGSGPHSGSPGTPRFGFPFRAAAEFHAITGMFLFGIAVAMFFVLRSAGVPRAAWRRYGTAIGIMAVQGSLGYATYFSHVQADLTEAHVIVAALLVVSLIRLRLGFRVVRFRVVAPADRPAPY